MPDTYEIPRELRDRWIEAEDEFFAGLPTQQPELYQQGIQVVRSLADSLEDLLSPQELVDAYDTREDDWAEERIRTILDELPRSLDLHTARNAAFQLRLNELRPMFLEILSSLSEATRSGWSKLYEQQGDYTGRPYIRRFDYNPKTEKSVFLHPYLTESGKYVHSFETGQFDPDAGIRTVRDPTTPDGQTFDSPEDALDAYRSRLDGSAT